MKLRCVDAPSGIHYSSAVSLSTVYDKVDNESDYYSKYSTLSHGSSQRGSTSTITSDSSVKTVQTLGAPSGPPEIAKRSRLKTPNHSDDDDDDSHQNGNQLLESLGKRIATPESNGRIMSAKEKKYGKNPVIDSIVSTTLFEASDESDSNSRRAASVRRDSGTIPRSATVSSAMYAKVRKNEASTMPKSKSVPDFTCADNEYGYSSVGDLSQSAFQSERRSNKNRPRDSSIPNECFKLTKVELEADKSDPLGILRRSEQRTYLSSKEFFQYFDDSFQEWGERFGLKEEDLLRAVPFRSAIRCIPGDSAHRLPIDFTPAIPVTYWPNVAMEWRNRSRQKVWDKLTGTWCTWPTKRQVDEISQQGCYLIKGTSELDWQLSFSGAEESLMSSLTQCHWRCLIWIHLIYRNTLAEGGFIDFDHINHLFLWLVERNYFDWYEANLGDKLFNYFKELKENIAKRKMQHYFIKECNLLSSRPGDRSHQGKLIKSQNILHRLIEGFLPITIHSAHRIHVHQGKSKYPFPDLKKLWRLLTSKTLLVDINPELGMMTSKQDETPMQDDDEGISLMNTSQQDQTQKLLHEAYNRTRSKANSRQAKISKVQAIQIDVPIEPMDDLRTKLVLCYFIDHLIEMAKSANIVRDFSSVTVVLNQAENLATILNDYDEAGDYKMEIDKIRSAAYPGKFQQKYVDIPGTPCVYQQNSTEGFANTADQRDSSASNNWLMKATTPLPNTPNDDSITIDLTENEQHIQSLKNKMKKTLNSIPVDLSANNLMNADKTSSHDQEPIKNEQTTIVSVTIENHNANQISFLLQEAQADESTDL